MSETRGRLLGMLALVGAGCTKLIGLPDLPDVSNEAGASSGATSGSGGVTGLGGSSAGKSAQNGGSTSGGSTSGGSTSGGSANGGSANGGDSNGATGGTLGGSSNGGSTTDGGAGTDSAGAGDVGTGGTGGSGASAGTGGAGGTAGSTGGCTPECDHGMVCTSGSCACPSGQSTCSSTCVDLKSDPDNCGKCGHTCTGKCGGGYCYRELVDVPTSGAVYLAVDASYVYFTRTSDGTVSRVPRSGGTDTVLASSQDNPRALAVDASNVYWANEPSTYGSGSVMKRALSGGNPTALATGEPSPAFVAVDANNVYWSNFPPQPPLFMSVPIGGGTKVEFPQGNELANSVEFSMDSTTLYWAGWYDMGGVFSTPLTGTGTIKTLATVDANTARAVVYGSDVYFLAGGPSIPPTVKKVAKTGGTPTDIVGLSGAYLNVDASGIYVGGTTPAGGVNNSIVRVSFDGNTVTTLAVAASALYAFAFGDTEVFWVDSDLTIKAASKNP